MHHAIFTLTTLTICGLQTFNIRQKSYECYFMYSEKEYWNLESKYIRGRIHTAAIFRHDLFMYIFSTALRLRQK